MTNVTGGRLDAILEFARIFREQTGSRLAFLHADLIWQNKWQPQLLQWRERLRSSGMRYGVVFDGEPGDHSDAEWAQQAISRYHLVMSNPTMAPDDVIFQSWQKLPTHALPDNASGTLTNIRGQESEEVRTMMRWRRASA